MQIQFEVIGDIQLSRNLRLLTTNLTNLGEFFLEACGIVKDRTDDIFKKQGSNVEK